MFGVRFVTVDSEADRRLKACDMRKKDKAVTQMMTEFEDKEGMPIRDLLIEKFERLGSAAAVAEEMGLNKSTISVWVDRLGLEAWTILRVKTKKDTD